MPPCENNPRCENKKCPISSKKVKLGANPDSINSITPSWSFTKCDKSGRWAFAEESIGDFFWAEIDLLPKNVVHSK